MPAARARWIWGIVAVASVAALSFVLFLRPGFLSGSRQDKTVAGPTAELERRGDSIVIPESSTYRTRIVVWEVQQRSISRTKTFPAVVEADPARTTNILSPIAGQITSLQVQLADRVSQGQLLAKLQSGDLAQAVSDLAKSKASVELSRKALDRTRDLAKIGGSAVKDFEQATNDFAQATAEMQRANERLRVIGSRAEIADNRTLNIVAPFSGTITALNIAAGAFVNDPTATLMTLTNVDKVFVTANVPEEDIGFVHVGSEVQVVLQAYPGVVRRGKIDTISDVLDSDTRRVKARVVFDNGDDRLRPNMFATVTAVEPTVQQRPVVPTSALILNNDSVFVFVEKEPWVFERQAVETDADQDGVAVVRKGLTAGERVVVRGGVLLQ